MVCVSNFLDFEILTTTAVRSALPSSSRRGLRRPFANEADRPPSAQPGLLTRLSPHEITADAGGPRETTSSVLDAVPKLPTPRLVKLDKQLDSALVSANGIHADFNAHLAARLSLEPQMNKPQSSPEAASVQSSQTTASSANHSTFSRPKERRETSHWARHYAERKLAKLGTHVHRAYDPISYLHSPVSASKITLPLLLASQTHLGHATSLWNPRNSGYIFGIRDGIHIISLDITAAYLRRAAKIVTEVAKKGGLILFVGTRDGHEPIVVNAANLAGGYHVFDSWTPGTLTNRQQILGKCMLKVVDIHDNEIQEFKPKLEESAIVGAHPVLSPDLVICLNPLENRACLHECGLTIVPSIGIIDTDADPSWVTYPIPANDDSLRSVGLIAGVLARAAEEGQRSRKLKAQDGRATYNYSAVDKFLNGLQEIRAGVAVKDGGGELGLGVEENMNGGTQRKREGAVA